MRSRVEARGFEVFAHVGDNRQCLGWQWNRRMLNQPVHVVDAEANALQVECGDRAIERFRFLDQARKLIFRRGHRSDDRQEFVQAALGGLAVFSGHDC